MNDHLNKDNSFKIIHFRFYLLFYSHPNLVSIIRNINTYLIIFFNENNIVYTKRIYMEIKNEWQN